MKFDEVLKQKEEELESVKAEFEDYRNAKDSEIFELKEEHDRLIDRQREYYQSKLSLLKNNLKEYAVLAGKKLKNFEFSNFIFCGFLSYLGGFLVGFVVFDAPFVV